MDLVQRLQQRTLRSRRLPLIGITLALLILGGTIYVGTFRLRERIRIQIAGRDASILHSVALMHQLTQEAQGELGGELEEGTDQFAILIHISQLRGVIAARLFDHTGEFYAPFPATVREGVLETSDVQRLQNLLPVGRFHPHAKLPTVFGEATSPRRTEPLLEVLIPLHRKDATELLGIVQFFIDGQSIAAEYAQLDQGLFTQAGLAFVASGLLMTGGLGWAFRRLQRTSGLLLERTQRLTQANEELALAAKTSAVGAISAHLIHGLSNPLAGLQDFVASRGRGSEETEWQDAITTAGQMQKLIAEIVRIIGDEHGDDRYEVTVHELGDALVLKSKPLTVGTGVSCEIKTDGTGVFPNREANLALLILENFVKNAIEASPAGRSGSLPDRRDQRGR